ncbi:hypothetical protein DFH07DRAFT_781222 [Mycena maculata]|uniref:Zn(2)-C6 fungal-type domain-containing protein n=1 Tax=Mycena maculata TaxID=230809 RepID=A0AAD7HZF6_9AGAR|nr:hypothetical protein DFH07DRAFT_781222 [Mycena maculata]
MSHLTPETFLSSTRTSRKKRAEVACVQCRRHKKKCIAPKGDPLPPCKRCSARGLFCEYIHIAGEHTQSSSTLGSGGPVPSTAGSQPRNEIYDQYPRVDPAYAAPSQFGPSSRPQTGHSQQPYSNSSGYSGVYAAPSQSTQFVPTSGPQAGHWQQPYSGSSGQYSGMYAASSQSVSQAVPPSNHQGHHLFQPHSDSGQYDYGYGAPPHSESFISPEMQLSAPSSSYQQQPTINVNFNETGYEPNQYSV